MNDNLILPVIFILVVFASIVTKTYFFEIQNNKLYQLTIDQRNTDLDNLATILGDKLNSTFDIISSTSGLPYCKNVIEQHGGTISASTNPTIFTIILPK
jgi:hypothetical protein